MELTIRTLTLFFAVVLTGLSAGLFYAWQVSVIPGTRKVADMTYLQTMQSINRAILNPAFYLTFFGCPIMLATSAIQLYDVRFSFWFLLGATLVYLIGTFGVTLFGNLPLNDTLDAMDLTGLAENEAMEFRQYFENKWNRFHLVRTTFSILSFLLCLLAAFSYSNQ